MSQLGGMYDIEPDQVRTTLQSVHTVAQTQLSTYQDLVTLVQAAGDGAGRLPAVVGALDDVVTWVTDAANRLETEWANGFTTVGQAVQIYTFGDAAMAQETVLDMDQYRPPVRIFDTTALGGP